MLKKKFHEILIWISIIEIHLKDRFLDAEVYFQILHSFARSKFWISKFPNNSSSFLNTTSSNSMEQLTITVFSLSGGSR